MKLKCTNPVHSDNLTALLGDEKWGESCSESILLLSLTGFIWKSCLLARDKCSFFFSCLRSCWTLFFPPGVRKQELKIVCDPDTVQWKVISFIMLLIPWILLIRKKKICSPKTEGVNHSIQGNLKYQRNWRSSWKRANPYIFQFSLYFMWLLPSSPLPPAPYSLNVVLDYLELSK